MLRFVTLGGPSALQDPAAVQTIVALRVQVHVLLSGERSTESQRYTQCEIVTRCAEGRTSPAQCALTIGHRRRGARSNGCAQARPS